MSLTNRDREILDFEGQFFRFTAIKEQTARDRFDMSATRYTQVVNALLDRPEALAYAPTTVKRLRRLRATRQRQRSARKLA